MAAHPTDRTMRESADRVQKVGMGRDDCGSVVAAHVGPAAPGRRR